MTIAALRLGAIDMAVADVLGSNMFNLAIITPVDIAYRRGPVLSLVSEVHLVTAAIVMVMTAIVIVGLRFRPQGKRSISWHTAVLIGLYIFGMYRLFIAGTELG